MLAERFQLFHQLVADVVEVFENGFQTFGSHCFHAHQSAFDASLSHGIEELGVFGGFHGDLRIEDHVARKSFHLRHKLEALIADGLKLRDFGCIVLFASQAKVRQGHWIEVVIREGDKAKAQSSQSYNLFNHGVEVPLTRALPIGAPDRAEGAMLSASTDGLHGRPHVLVAGHEIPTGGKKFVRLDATTLVDLLRIAVDTVFKDACPNDVAVAFDYTGGASQFQGFFGIERGVNAAIHNERASFAGDFSYLIAAKHIAGMDADSDDVAGLNGLGIEKF